MRRAWYVVLAAALLSGCAAHRSPAARTPGSAAQRIVTLMPSFADDLDALGAVPELVGVSAFTDVPAAASLPRVADASSIGVETIVALHPTLVVGIPSQGRLLESLRGAGIRIVLLPDDTFDEIFTNLDALGALTGRRAQAAAVIARLRRETAEAHRQTRRFLRRPSVFVVLGSAPIWTAGSTSYVATLIALAGGANAAADLHAAYGQYSAEALLRDRPDMLVTDPATNLQAVLDREPWRSLPAVRLHHVYTVNPDTFERPGPRYNEAIRWLVDRLTPLATL